MGTTLVPVPWKFQNRKCCHHCKLVFPVKATAGYCPHCWPRKCFVDVGQFRWIRTSKWWEFWVRGKGYWLPMMAPFTRYADAPPRPPSR